MSANFVDDGAQLDQDLAGLRNRLSSVEQSGGGGGSGTPPSEKWYRMAHYRPSEPEGGYHNSPAGLVVSPNEPIQLHEAMISAGSAGTLIVQIFPQRDSGAQGYPHAPLTRYEFDELDRETAYAIHDPTRLLAILGIKKSSK